MAPLQYRWRNRNEWTPGSMGWLRDLILRTEPRIGSLGEVARRALAHPDWPKTSTIQERSLASLLSKLDRGQELDWLRDRPVELGVLGHVLGRPVAELRMLMGDEPVRQDRRLLRLLDLRYARDLDLVREELPPGIPPEVAHPVHWSPPLVWLSPPGSGRSLVEAFLEARGLAHVGRGFDPGAPPPAYGALFIELPEGMHLRRSDLLQLTGKARPLCIAVARRAQVAEVLSELRFVTAAEPSEYLEELASWVGERIGSDGYFDAERATSWLRRSLLPQLPTSNFGDLLGLLGLFDEIPSRELLKSDLPQVLRLFVSRRVRDTRESPSLAPDRVFGALVMVAARLLSERGEPLALPRTSADWLGLLPIEPSPHQLFRTLLLAGLLRRTWFPQSAKDLEHYSLGPRCLIALLETLAQEDLLNAPTQDFARVFLAAKGHEAERALMKRLVRRTEEGNFRSHYELLEGTEGSDLEGELFVHALEVGVESLGMGTMMGSSPPQELGQGLLSEYSRYIVRVGDQLETRVRPVEPVLLGFLALCVETGGASREVDPIRHSESRLLENLSERLFSWALASNPLLDDAGHNGEARLTLVLSILMRAWQAREEVSEALSEGLRAVLLTLLRPSDGDGRSAVLLALRHVPLRVLEGALANEGASLAPLHEKLWAELIALGDVALSPEILPALGGARAAFFRAAPERAVNTFGLEALLRFDLLLPHQLEARLKTGPLPIPEGAAAVGAVETALRRLESEGPDALGSDAVAALCRRAPKLTTRCLLRRFMTTGSTSDFAAIAHHNQLATLLTELPTAPELLTLGSDRLNPIRLGLLELTRSAALPDVRSAAYARLDELERNLR